MVLDVGLDILGAKHAGGDVDDGTVDIKWEVVVRANTFLRWTGSSMKAWRRFGSKSLIDCSWIFVWWTAVVMNSSLGNSHDCLYIASIWAMYNSTTRLGFVRWWRYCHAHLGDVVGGFRHCIVQCGVTYENWPAPARTRNTGTRLCQHDLEGLSQSTRTDLQSLLSSPSSGLVHIQNTHYFVSQPLFLASPARCSAHND